MFTQRRIIVHHSLTKDSGTVSWGAIRFYHMTTNGWSDIGYHAGIELVQSGEHRYYEILIGRDWFKEGAHCQGENYDSLGFCFVGDFDNELIPFTQLGRGAEFLAMWCRMFNLSVDDIYPHRWFNNQKTCPGKLFSMTDLKDLIRSY